MGRAICYQLGNNSKLHLSHSHQGIYATEARSPEMTQDDRNNCKWIYTDVNGEQALAVVTDLYEFSTALVSCIRQAKSRQLRQNLEAILDSVEFAPVTVQRNGMVKWQNGVFAKGMRDAGS
jgi:hypothetical protein